MTEEAAATYSLSDSDVLTKYKAASDITQKALKKVVDACEAGKSLLSLCQLGDQAMEELAKTVYTKGKIIKGIAFPTCISVNNIISYFSPLLSDPEAANELKAGDLVKIELGAHVDGLATITAHSLVVGASKENPITGRQAQVLKAAYLASEVAVRLLKPKNKNSQITEAVAKVTEEFNVKAVEGVISHQQERNIINGKKQIILNPPENQKNYERFDFEEGETWTIDIIVSSGEGKPKDSGLRTTVYKKAATTYQLKMKTSRSVYSEITAKYGLFPFNLRDLADEKRARMGIQECAKHEVVSSYPIYHEKEGEFVARFMFTVLLTPSGVVRLNASLYDPALVQTELELKDAELVELLSTTIGKSKKKNKKKKSAAAGAAAADGGEGGGGEGGEEEAE